MTTEHFFGGAGAPPDSNRAPSGAQGGAGAPPDSNCAPLWAPDGEAPPEHAGAPAAGAPDAKRPAAPMSDEELLDALRECARRKSAPLVSTDLRDTPLYSRLIRRFGNWSTAMERAGLDRPAGCRPYTDEECFANLAMLWRHHGRPPRASDTTRPPSAIGPAAYLRRSKSWARAIAGFAMFTGKEAKPRARRAGGEPTAPQPEQERRRVRNSIRFQVLQRDRFRCVACGASPATHAGCILHVDHVVPYSRGGRTEPQNLRTLCAQCNQGRGAREA